MTRPYAISIAIASIFTATSLYIVWNFGYISGRHEATMKAINETRCKWMRDLETLTPTQSIEYKTRCL